MIKSGVRQRARELVAVLMTHPRTIATPLSSFPKPPPISAQFATLRRSPPPPSPARFITMATAAAETADIDALFQQKKALRAKVKKDLKSMDLVLRSQQDDEIQKHVLEASWFKSCKRLCAYISCASLREVDTSKILAEILKDMSTDGDLQMRKKLYVPRVEDKNRNMRMLNISIIDDLVANSMNILEPAPVNAEGEEREDVLLAHEPVDLLLLPGLAFDKSGRRLGRGGGYYDTFLGKYHELAKKNNWKQPLLIALSYSVQILDEGIIPMTPADVPVDALVTPSGVIPITPVASDLLQ